MFHGDFPIFRWAISKSCICWVFDIFPDSVHCHKLPLCWHNLPFFLIIFTFLMVKGGILCPSMSHFASEIGLLVSGPNGSVVAGRCFSISTPAALVKILLGPSGFYRIILSTLTGWWFQPLWKNISSSVGMILPNIWKNVPNHQAANIDFLLVSTLTSICCWYIGHKTPKTMMTTTTWDGSKT